MSSAARISNSLRHGDERSVLWVGSHTNVEKSKLFVLTVNHTQTVLL
jgi:hypothetical protein